MPLMVPRSALLNEYFPSSGVAAGVHIARLKQFSGHASLKRLEEYVELDELRHNHPLKDVL